MIMNSSEHFELGELPVASVESLRYNRKRIEALGCYLGINAINMSRLASFFSELTSQLQSGRDTNASISLIADPDGNYLMLALTTGSEEIPFTEEQLKTVFDRAEIIRNPYRVCIRISLVLNPLFELTDATVGKARELLLQRSNAELMQDLRLARDSEAAANQAKSAFLAAMSHEIRTPMNGIVGMAEVMAKTQLDEMQSDSLKTILDSAFSLLRIIDDILDFSKIEAGRLELEQADVSIWDIIEGICISLRPVAQSKGVNLDLFIDPNIPDKVITDSVRLRQVFYNLVGNAIKFSSNEENKGQVFVRVDVVSIVPLTLDFSVADNGIGMTEETLSVLFSSFQQAESSTTRRFGGTGLGLAICKRLVELMGGDIAVASTPDEGSVFTVSLTFDVPDSPVESQRIALEMIDCILVPSVSLRANDIRIYLQSAGAKVYQVNDINEAFAVADQLNTPHPVIIHDLADQEPSDALLQRVHDNLHCIGYLLLQVEGFRARPRQDDSGIVRLDSSILCRAALQNAVAVAAGRASPDIFIDPALNDMEAVKTAPTIAQAREEGRLILVAEDDFVNRKVILQQLNLLGFAAEVAEDGQQALEMWRKGAYALLLTDLHMPNMDGYALAKSIRAEEHGASRMPILALTANALRGEAVRARKVGIDDYLTKPIQISILDDALTQWLLPGAEPAEAGDTGIPHTDVPQEEPAGLGIWDVAELKALVGDDRDIIAELLNDYLSQLVSLRDELDSASQNGDYMRMVGLAHRLKSSSRSVGAMQLGDVCAELENACTRKNPTDIERYVNRFGPLVLNTQTQIMSYLETKS